MTTYPLEPGPERMQELGQATLDWVTRFVEGLARAPSDGRSTATPSTGTRVGGRVLLRLCILSHRTHLVHVDRALQIIHAAAREP